MNETNNTPRQRFILNLINQSDGFLRAEIQSKVASSYKISKPTLIRDLGSLMIKKLIRIEGRGEKYQILSTLKKSTSQTV